MVAYGVIVAMAWSLCVMLLVGGGPQVLEDLRLRNTQHAEQRDEQ